MTREDLLKGNCEIAANLGDNIRKYCPEVKHVMIIFNPADVTALTVLIHSGLRPCRVSSLAALDSTRLQTNLAKEFGVRQSDVENAYTYGGHGESMAVFMSKATICGTPIARMGLTKERIAAIKQETIQGGAEIIKLRGRSSIQSPAYLSIKAIEAAMKGGEQFPLAVRYLCGHPRVQPRLHGHAYLHGRDRYPLHHAGRHQGRDGGPQGLLRAPGGPP
jgi:Malate/lactate dehydrogenases